MSGSERLQDRVAQANADRIGARAGRGVYRAGERTKAGSALRAVRSLNSALEEIISETEDQLATAPPHPAGPTTGEGSQATDLQPGHDVLELSPPPEGDAPRVPARQRARAATVRPANGSVAKSEHMMVGELADAIRNSGGPAVLDAAPAPVPSRPTRQSDVLVVDPDDDLPAIARRLPEPVAGELGSANPDARPDLAEVPHQAAVTRGGAVQWVIASGIVAALVTGYGATRLLESLPEESAERGVAFDTVQPSPVASVVATASGTGIAGPAPSTPPPPGERGQGTEAPAIGPRDMLSGVSEALALEKPALPGVAEPAPTVSAGGGQREITGAMEPFVASPVEPIVAGTHEVSIASLFPSQEGNAGKPAATEHAPTSVILDDDVPAPVPASRADMVPTVESLPGESQLRSAHEAYDQDEDAARLAKVAPLAPTRAITPASRPQVPPVSKATAPAPGSLSPNKTAALAVRAQKLLDDGDIASARLLLEHLSSAGLSASTEMLARTYDPAFLAGSNATGLRPNIPAAIKWYKLAVSQGSKTAARRARELADGEK